MHRDIQLTSESLRKKKLRNKTCRNTTWGVFKVYAVSCEIHVGFITENNT